MPQIHHLSIAEFKERRNANSQTVTIDVRDDEKWERGHIPGAVHIQKSQIAKTIGSVVPLKGTEIICHCGGGQSGAKAAELLAAMGYENVSVLDGGFRSYAASNDVG